MSATAIRPAAVAGLFYPREPAQLVHDVDGMLAGVDRAKNAPQPRALVVPHAGYVYSGPVAAHAYAQVAALAGRVDRVVLLGPSHHVYVAGMALPGASGLATPLGVVPVDQDLVERVRTLPGVTTLPAAHVREHSLEVQLPFLQRTLGTFTVLPLAVGDADPDDVARVMEACTDPRTLILVSTDLSHYLPYAAATRQDTRTVEQVRALEFDLDGDDNRACGAVPLAGLVRWARRAGLRPRVLDVRNSGDTAGPRDRVVGYASIAMVEA